MSAWSAASIRTAIRSSFPATTIIRSPSRCIRPAGSTPTYCPAADRVSITAALWFSLGRGGCSVAGSDVTGRGHFGIDATVGVIEVFQECARNCQVADSGVGIDVGCGTARYPLDDSCPRGLSDGDRLIEKIELTPG